MLQQGEGASIFVKNTGKLCWHLQLSYFKIRAEMMMATFVETFYTADVIL